MQRREDHVFHQIQIFKNNYQIIYLKNEFKQFY
jgi:hypothetical protein